MANNGIPIRDKMEDINIPSDKCILQLGNPTSSKEHLCKVANMQLGVTNYITKKS